jgi:hypothetical protein
MDDFQIMTSLNSKHLDADCVPLDQMINQLAVGAPGELPLSVLVVKALSPIGNPFTNKQTKTADGVFTAPKSGVYFISLIGNGGPGGASGRGVGTGFSVSYRSCPGQGGYGGYGYFLFRSPVYLLAGQAVAYTVSGTTAFGVLTVANGGPGGDGRDGQWSNSSTILPGGTGGTGGTGGIPGDGGVGGYGSEHRSGSGTGGTGGTIGGVYAISLFKVEYSSPTVVSSGTQYGGQGGKVTAVYSVPSVFLGSNGIGGLIAGKGGAGGAISFYSYEPATPDTVPGFAGSKGAVIIEWD